ncbi:mitochondrial ribosomal protein L45 isoform X2 [Oratosquilla oratoria]
MIMPVRSVYKQPKEYPVPIKPFRNPRKKHYNPKFKMDRQLKVMKMDLPDFQEREKVDEMTPDEVRAKMKEKGIQPMRSWMEKPLNISSTAGTFEQYVPPEGDGKISATTAAGAMQKFEFLGKKGKSMMAIRKIRQFDEDFDPKEFVEEAQDIYIQAHEALAKFDKARLHELVTERAYPLVTHQAYRKTIHWQFLKSLEPPRLMHARSTHVVTKENVFAQITVRFHTQQLLAVYDRFGRLIHGSEVVARDVLEYVVFEKHLANTYGVWRIHDKIIPDWMPPRQPIRNTYKFEEPELDEEPESTEEATTEPAKERAEAAA